MSIDPKPLSLAEFIAWEERQQSKHEFRAGAVYAMAGASDDHNQIVANLLALIRPSLRGGPCRIYANDMKLATDFPGLRYPDVLVTCDIQDSRDRLVKRHPCVIIEVLSASTAGEDASDKLDEYQSISELEEYVLIDSRRRSIRIYRRNAESFETYRPIISGTLSLRSIRLDVTVDEIYEDVDFARTTAHN